MVDLHTYAGNRANLAELYARPNHTFIQADICDAEAMADVLREFRPAAIVHFAAESHVGRSIVIPAPSSAAMFKALSHCCNRRKLTGQD